MMKKKKQAGPRTAPPSLMNKDECGAAVDTDLFYETLDSIDEVW